MKIQKDGLLKDIELALWANNMEATTEFKQKMCQCDPEVGNRLCPYCVIYDALMRCKKYIESDGLEKTNL